MATTAVRVALRVRPLFEKENHDCNEASISYVQDQPQIYVGRDRSFTFDFVYPPKTTQNELYNSSIVPLLDRFTEGKNVTILAYGQTGSGKTYSMGTGLEPCSNPLDQGIIPRFANSLFDRMMEFKHSSENNTFQIYTSFLELYNEDINDLLVVPEHSDQLQENHPTIREDNNGNIYWAGVKEERVYTVNDLIKHLRIGSQRRTTGSTEMNKTSSRSHAVFSVILKQQTENDDADNTRLSSSLVTMEQDISYSKRLVSKFHFVDLAGSERLKRTNALGDRQKEGIFINSGLLALGNVISALGDESKKTQHVPYRDSKLTRLLQDSLGGNSHTLMLACVSPSSSDSTETLNTLKYANRARNIQNRVEINQDLIQGSEESQHLRDQVSYLKLQVAMLRDVNGNQVLDKELQTMKDEINNIKTYSHQISKELAEAQSERDSLLLQLTDDGVLPAEPHPIIQQYAHELQDLRLEIVETRSKLNALADGGRVSDKDRGSIKVSSSMGFFDSKKKKSLVDDYPKKGSSSPGRRDKRRPIIHRMKTQSSLSVKKKNSQRDMDELLELLRQEYVHGDPYFPHDINEQSIDETVLQETSHAEESTASAAVAVENLPCEAEFAIEAFPKIPTKKIEMPADICPPNNTFEDDELEALTVPSWSDAPKTQSVDGSTKRKSISLDSMWDDTDSSITTSRVASSTTWGRGTDITIVNQTGSKDMGREGRNLLKMLHQIQADLLVKRELVGQLEKSEDQYTQMRVNYEERLGELKDHLLEIQNQRDAALKKTGATTIAPVANITPTPDRPQSALQLRENRQAQEVRSQYEVKIKRLVAENQELRKKHTQSTQAVLTARAKAEGVVGRLRADIEALKLDKKQLNRGLKTEVDKAREAAAAYEREAQQLKRRILIAFDDKKKLKETNDAQNQVLNKRTEEIATANLQMRHLTNALRKAANEGTFLNEVSLEKILESANLASAKSNARKSLIGSRLVARSNPSSRTNSPTI